MERQTGVGLVDRAVLTGVHVKSNTTQEMATLRPIRAFLVSSLCGLAGLLACVAPVNATSASDDGADAYAQVTGEPAEETAAQGRVDPELERQRLLEEGAGIPKPMVRLIGDNSVVRSGPGESYSLMGLFPKGEVFEVIAKSGNWYNVRLSENETGWIHSSLCKPFDDLSGLELRPNPRLYSRIGTFTFTGYAGGYSFDQKANSFSLGGRVGYYLLDFLEVEGGLSWARIHRPAEIVESLFDLSLEEEEFHMVYYHFGVKLEALPGRRMVPFVVGGVGSTVMQGETEASFNYGAGTQFFLSKTLSTRWELRKYQFDSGFDRSRRTNHNVEFSFGATILY